MTDAAASSASASAGEDADGEGADDEDVDGEDAVAAAVAAADADAVAAAVATAREVVARSAAALRGGAAREEALAEFVPERRVLGIPRAARMTRIGAVWRLGVLLLGAELGAEPVVFATGRVVRAERPARKSVLANAVAEQRALRAAAVKGGLDEGQTVNFDATTVDFDQLARVGASGPLLLRGGVAVVRWNRAQPDALIELGRYLDDRVDLLVHPPERA